MSRYFFYDNCEIPSRIRKDSSSSISDHCAGKFYMASGDRNALCADYVLSISVGFELPESTGIQ